MPNKKEPDLISKICGEETRYKEAWEHYEESSRHCLLLREGRIKEIWENERCISYEILNDALKKEFSRHKKEYPDIPVDINLTKNFYSKEIVSDTVRAVANKMRASKKPFDHPSLAAWKRYLLRAASNYVINYLFPKRITPRCGVCKYLSESKICELKEIITHGELQENPYYEKHRKRSDRHCEAGYSPNIPIFMPISSDPTDRGGIELPDISTPDTLSSVTNKDIVFKYITLLRERAEEAPENSKKRKKLMRQYLVATRFYQLLTEEYSEKEAKSHLKKEYSSRSTFNRDFTDIKKFFLSQKKMIQNGQ